LYITMAGWRDWPLFFGGMAGLGRFCGGIGYPLGGGALNGSQKHYLSNDVKHAT